MSRRSYEKEKKRQVNKKRDIRTKSRIEQERYLYRKRLRNKQIIKRIIPFAVVLSIIIIISAFFAGGAFNLNSVTITGNNLYEKQEIVQQMIDEPYCQYTPVFFVTYSWLKPRLPFVASMKLKLTSLHSISLKVTEKPILVAVFFNNSYYILDSDKIIIKISKEKPDKIPILKDIELKNPKLYSPIVVDSEGKLGELLTVVQALSRYSLSNAEIYFDENNLLTMDLRDYRIELGTMDGDVNSKINALVSILPKIKEKSGTIKLTHYKKKGDYVIFTPNH